MFCTLSVSLVPCLSELSAHVEASLQNKMLKGGNEYNDFFGNDQCIQSVTQAITQKKEMLVFIYYKFQSLNNRSFQL